MATASDDRRDLVPGAARERGRRPLPLVSGRCSLEPRRPLSLTPLDPDRRARLGSSDPERPCQGGPPCSRASTTTRSTRRPSRSPTPRPATATSTTATGSTATPRTASSTSASAWRSTRTAGSSTAASRSCATASSTPSTPRAGAGDPSRHEVGPFRIEILEPMRRVRVAIAPNETGIECDLVFDARTACIEEGRQTTRRGGRLMMDATRFAQFGRWQGEIRYAGTTPARSRRRASTAPRTARGACVPVGEPETGGAPARRRCRRSSSCGRRSSGRIAARTSSCSRTRPARPGTRTA